MAEDTATKLRAAILSELGLADTPDAAIDGNFKLDLPCFSRCLHARGNDQQAAGKMLRATIAWRREFGVSRLAPDHFETIAREASSGKSFVLPFKDAEGRPIMIMRPRNENSKGDHDANIMHLVYQLERAVSAASAAGHEKWVVIMDFNGYSMSNAPPMRTTRATISILQDHYPERLHRAYLVDAPWLFQGVFKAIAPFIDSVTRAKICFTSSSPDGLAMLLPAESLEQSLGGASCFSFQAEEYLAEDRARCSVSKEEAQEEIKL